VLQIDSNDELLKSINTLQLAERIEEISMDDKSRQYEERELMSTSGQLLINLVCFETSVRIRNPLIHKLCKPSDHKNRLILYSYEHVYKLITEKKLIRCIFPHCSNFFDHNNFSEMAVVVEYIHKLIYEEYKECVYG
jgi:hypothetical protein